MEQSIIELWADISSESYWNDLIKSNPSIFVPFSERWPQPGFIGRHYLDTERRVAVMGQNPRASNTASTMSGDTEMFRLIRDHSEVRSNDSLHTLFSMMHSFMLGIRYGRAWTPVQAVTRHLNLKLDNIAYLNLIPLATHQDRIIPAFEEAYERSTMLQLRCLNPDKIVVFGKGAYEKFERLGEFDQYDTRYIEQRNFKDAPSVKKWLNS